MKINEIQILGANGAPNTFAVKKVVRYGKREILIQTVDGKIYSATLSRWWGRVRDDSADLLRALVRLGVTTTKEAATWRAAEKERTEKENREYDVNQLQSKLDKYGVKLGAAQRRKLCRAVSA